MRSSKLGASSGSSPRNNFGQATQNTDSIFGGTTNPPSQPQPFSVFSFEPSATNTFGNNPTTMFGIGGQTMVNRPFPLFTTEAIKNQAGTSVPFKAVCGGPDALIAGNSHVICETKLLCITCMEEYENKSLEELRAEDYRLGRKGLSQSLFDGSRSEDLSEKCAQPNANIFSNSPSAPFGGGFVPFESFGISNPFNQQGIFQQPQQFTFGGGLFDFGQKPTPVKPPSGPSGNFFETTKTPQAGGIGLFSRTPATTSFGGGTAPQFSIPTGGTFGSQLPEPQKFSFQPQQQNSVFSFGNRIEPQQQNAAFSFGNWNPQLQHATFSFGNRNETQQQPNRIETQQQPNATFSFGNQILQQQPNATNPVFTFQSTGSSVFGGTTGLQTFKFSNFSTPVPGTMGLGTTDPNFGAKGSGSTIVSPENFSSGNPVRAPIYENRFTTKTEIVFSMHN